MPEWIISLLADNYDESHGVVNSRPVVDAVISKSDRPFEDLSNTFEDASRQWQLPLVDAMRTLAATGYCTADDAQLMLDATRTVAEVAGSEEYFKTVNAMVSAQNSSAAVVAFVASLLGDADEFQRRLAFYAVALVAERRTASISVQLRNQLSVEANRETSRVRRKQFLDVLARLPMTI
jgi:hypothetical protein